MNLPNNLNGRGRLHVNRRGRLHVRSALGMFPQLRVVRQRQPLVAQSSNDVLGEWLVPMGLGRTEHLFGYPVVVFDLAPPDLGPHVVAAARHDHREPLTWKLGEPRQVVLGRAKFVKRVLEFHGQQLRHDAVDGFEREAAAREVHLPGRRHDVRLVAGVHDERFAIDADNRLEQ